jgi:DNA repair exonuclease SbcCD ATPase subunit
MLKITNLTIKNFLSVGNVTQAVKLNDNGLTLVLGSNTDSNGGTTRNGAGKSTILQAISFALFGKPLTKIKIPNLINNINGKQMLVTIEFESDGKTYKIERGKKPDVMKFYMNSEEQHLDPEDETKGENRHTQEEIDRLIGMSHTMFKHIVALNTFTDPFLKMSAADQRSVIEELLGITQISQRADVLKKLIAATKEAIRDNEASIRATTETNERINNAIRQAEIKAQAWETTHTAKIENLAGELAEMEAMDFDAEIATFDAIDAYDASKRDLETAHTSVLREISFLTDKLAAEQREITRLETAARSGSGAQISRLQSEHKRKLTEVERSTQRKLALESELDGVRNDLANSDASDCICCGQSIAGTDHLATIVANLNVKIGELANEIGGVEGEILARSDEAEAVVADIAKLQNEDDATKLEIDRQIAEKIPAVEDIAKKMADQEAIVAEHAAAIADLGARPRSVFRTRDDVYRARSERENIERTIEHEMSLTNPNLGQIDDYKKALQKVDYEPLNEKTDLLKHQEFLLKLLTNKDSFIRKKIIDQNLAYLNARLNHYLDKLGLPHEVIFQSDLSVDITMLGRDFDFEQLSRGEMNRVIMATSWSFRDVWESQNEALNLCWIDELLDNGLDSHGVETALSILKSMARDRGKNVFLISHRDELQARIDRTLLVRKENGFTTFEPDAT